MNLALEIKSKTQIVRGFYAEDILMISLYFIFFYLLGEVVYPPLLLAYYAFNVFVALYLFSGSKSPGRKKIHIIIFALIKRFESQRYATVHKNLSDIAIKS